MCQALEALIWAGACEAFQEEADGQPRRGQQVPHLDDALEVGQARDVLVACPARLRPGAGDEQPRGVQLGRDPGLHLWVLADQVHSPCARVACNMQPQKPS